MDLTDEQWKQKLTAEQYAVLRQKGTEPPYSGQLLNENGKGDFSCAACDSLLFHSDAKYESTIPGLMGWPSFAEAVNNEAVELRDDDSYGMHRTEVVCRTCGSHLGHIFDDDTAPTGKHYCVNAISLNFKPGK